MKAKQNEGLMSTQELRDALSLPPASNEAATIAIGRFLDKKEREKEHREYERVMVEKRLREMQEREDQIKAEDQSRKRI
jgi:hypothetical protein